MCPTAGHIGVGGYTSPHASPSMQRQLLSGDSGLWPHIQPRKLCLTEQPTMQLHGLSAPVLVSHALCIGWSCGA